MNTGRLTFFALILVSLNAEIILFAQPPSNSDTVRPPIPANTIPGNTTLINDVDELDVSSLGRYKFDAETKFVSNASRVFAIHHPQIATRSPAAMVSAARKFLESLDENQASKAVFKLDSRERSQWTNLPARPDAGGLRMDELNESQTRLVCNLLATLLSESGYQKLRLIMLGDDYLIRGRQPRGGIGSHAFSIVIFGEPNPQKLWAIQFDGHHVGLNIAIKGNQMTLGPSFIGAQPFEYELGAHKKIRPLEAEREMAFRLAGSLSESQFREALKSDRRGDLVAGPGKDKYVPEASGASCGEFTDQQKSVILGLISAWVNWLPEAQAKERMEQVRAEIDDMKFSWSGPRKAGSDVSYVIQSPSLLIEFAYQNLGGVPQQHLHTQYRNLKNDYGKNFK